MTSECQNDDNGNKLNSNEIKSECILASARTQLAF
jgi:hypothetical protein